MKSARCKPHNAFTNHEVEVIRKYWPTLMPMAELLALLPRHTENSVTTYANKVLRLRRPTSRSAPGSPRAQPTWERVRSMIEHVPTSQLEISEAMGFSRARASEILNAHRNEVHIAGWRWLETGRAQALWLLGSRPDVPEPIGRQRARRMERLTNPFLVASGAIAAPNGQPGRVVINLHDDDFEDAA